VTHFFPSWCSSPLVGQGLLVIEASRWHSDKRHTTGLLWTSDQLDAETSWPDNTQHSQETDIHSLGGIRTHDPSNRAATDPHVGLRGHRDGIYGSMCTQIWVPTSRLRNAAVGYETVRATRSCFDLQNFVTILVHKFGLQKFTRSLIRGGDRGSTVVKVLCYKSEGRWCHWIFHWHNPSDRTMALGSTQPITELSTRSISWG